MKNLFLLIASSLYLSNAIAGASPTGPVYIEVVSIIEVATAGHAAGNLEVKIQGGLPALPGISCDNFYLTTQKINDANKRLFTLLTLAKINKSPVELYINDDPAYTAIPGRCNITAATLL